MDARRLSPSCDVQAEVVLPAASPRMRGGCRLPATFKPKWSYLLPRRGCEAAVALPVVAKTTGCRSRFTCRLAVNARRLSRCLRPGVDLRPKSFYLPPCCGCEAAVAFLRPGCPKAEVDIPAASPWMRGGCRLPATYKPGTRNRYSCRCRPENKIVIPAALP